MVLEMNCYQCLKESQNLLCDGCNAANEAKERSIRINDVFEAMRRMTTENLNELWCDVCGDNDSKGGLPDGSD